MSEDPLPAFTWRRRWKFVDALIWVAAWFAGYYAGKALHLHLTLPPLAWIWKLATVVFCTVVLYYAVQRGIAALRPRPAGDTLWGLQLASQVFITALCVGTLI